MAYRSSSIVAGADGVNGAVPVPTGAAAGDIVTVYLYKENTEAITAPDGTWTQKTALTANVGTQGTLYVLWKRLTAADTGTYTFSWTTSAWRELVAVAHSGRRSTGDPFDGTPGTAESAGSVTTLNVAASPTAAGGDAVGAWTNFSGGTNFTPPTNYTERQDGDVMCVDTRDSVAAGSTGNVTATANHSGGMKAFLGVLAADTGPTPVTGALAGTLPGITGSLTGVIPQDVTGSISGALPGITGALSGTSDALPAPFVTAISGLHFVDQDGQPILIRGDTVWAAPVNFGRWNGGNWQGDCDTYMAARASQGYNALYMGALGSTQNNGSADTGATFDGVLPFVGGDPGVLNDTYWQRVDYILSSAEAHGITVFLDLAYSSDLDTAALSGKTAAQFTGYGTAIGTRYKNRPNLVYTFGGDYFDTFTTQLTNAFNAIRATGDTHVFSVQNFPESTSRRNLSTNAVENTGTAVAGYNFVYTYNWTYFGVEFGYSEPAPLLPVLWNDGHYDQNNTGDRRFMRNLTWWALSSGSRGNTIGVEAVWGWATGSLAAVTTPGAFTGTDLPAIRAYFASLTGWHLLLPDTDNSFVTAGRGTRAGSLPSGGGSEVTNATALSDYVGASVTPDGTLAVVYVPTGATITVNDAELVAGYTVKRVDPATCAETTLTPSSTYGGFGNNSQGQADWLLVFEAPTGVMGTVGGTLPAVTGAATGDVSVTGAAAGTLPAVTGSMAAALTASGPVAGTLPAVTGALTAGLGVTGVIDGDLEQVTGTLQAEATAAGSLTGTLPGVTGGLTGVVGTGVVGVLAGTLPGLTGGLAGAATAEGVLAGALPAIAGGLTGFVGVQLPAVDFTVTVAPARVRGRVTVAATRSDWATGDNRTSIDAADSRARERVTVADTHDLPRVAAAASRTGWQVGGNRTSVDVAPSRADRKE